LLISTLDSLWTDIVSSKSAFRKLYGESVQRSTTAATNIKDINADWAVPR
jgi:hypothetical protein